MNEFKRGFLATVGALSAMCVWSTLTDMVSDKKKKEANEEKKEEVKQDK